MAVARESEERCRQKDGLQRADGVFRGGGVYEVGLAAALLGFAKYDLIAVRQSDRPPIPHGILRSHQTTARRRTVARGGCPHAGTASDDRRSAGANARFAGTS